MLVDVVEDIVAALDHKNPKVKLCTIRLLQVRHRVAPDVAGLPSCGLRRSR